MQTKTIRRYTSHPLDWLSSKSEVMTSVGKGVENSEPKYTPDGNEKWQPL